MAQPNKVLAQISHWLRERDYAAVTNAAEGELVLDAVFADVPGGSPSSSCRFSTNPQQDTVLLNATFCPAIPDELLAPALGWLMVKNRGAKWGFYGLSVRERQLWFRIALYRPDGKISPAELDRMLAEATAAMHDADVLLSAQPDDEPTGAPTPDLENQTAPDAPRIIFLRAETRMRTQPEHMRASDLIQTPRARSTTHETQTKPAASGRAPKA